MKQLAGFEGSELKSTPSFPNKLLGPVTSSIGSKVKQTLFATLSRVGHTVQKRVPIFHQMSKGRRQSSQRVGIIRGARLD